MEQRIKQLVKRLALLGYCTFEIRNIFKDAVGHDSIEDISLVDGAKVIRQLEHYEQMGANYLLTYSK